MVCSFKSFGEFSRILKLTQSEFLKSSRFSEYQQGHTVADATRNICGCVAPDAVSHSTAKYWFQRFHKGNFSLEDRARSGRPSTLNIQKLHTLINWDPTQSTRNLARQLDTSHSTVERHLHKHGMEFRSGRWIYVDKNRSYTKSSSSSFDLINKTIQQTEDNMQTIHSTNLFGAEFDQSQQKRAKEANAPHTNSDYQILPFFS
jgi:transposase